MDKKVLVLVSGGLDSSVLLAKAVKNHGSDNVVGLNIFYGQKHAKEMECAEYQAKKYNIPLLSADLKDVFKYDTSCPLLADSQNELPTKSYAEQLADIGGEGTVTTYVPFRNGLFLSYATAVALQMGCSAILYGAHADDAAGRAYPDCTEDFIFTMNEAIMFGTGHKVELITPFYRMNKSAIVKLGIELNVDFAHTWSCYNGKLLPCGVCGTCIDRFAAFQANGIIDPFITDMCKTVNTDTVADLVFKESKCSICKKPVSECDRN